MRGPQITCDMPATRCAIPLRPWLRRREPWSLDEEYPLVFGDAALARATTIEEDGCLLAHAAYLDVTHVTRSPSREDTTTIRLVGSVVVAPTRRGEGLGRTLMTRVVEDFYASGADLLMLWSDQTEFYAQFGFQDWGSEFLLSPIPSRPEHTLRPAHPTDCDWITQTHERKTRRVHRRASDFERLLEIPRMTCWILEVDGQPMAYACVGKGLDFENVAHDMGGDDTALAELLRALPIHFAAIPREREALAQELGTPVCHPLGLALPQTTLEGHALEVARRVSIEGLDSI